MTRTITRTITVDDKVFTLYGKDQGHKTTVLAEHFCDMIEGIEECADLVKCADGDTFSAKTVYGNIIVRTKLDGNNDMTFTANYDEGELIPRHGLIYRTPFNTVL